MNGHGHWSEDVVAYALGALEPERVAEFERHLEGCERCRNELRWFAPAVQALSESVERVEPPAQLRAQLMAVVEGDPELAGGRDEAGAARRQAESGTRGRLAVWLRGFGSGSPAWRPVLGIAAAVLVVAVAGFAIAGGFGGGSGTGEGGTSTVVAGHPPGITAKMVREGDRGTLRLAHVHQLPMNKVLEAWVQREGEVEPVRALFVPDRAGRASTQLPDMAGVEVVMVTAEPRGGSKAPTSAPIVTIPVQ